MGTTILVSNRLPVRWTREEGQLQMHSSEGGLATGLSAIFAQEDSMWIGWPGLVPEDAAEQQFIAKQLRKNRIAPVFLTDQQIKGYYEGFSNEILWPIFHYISTYSNYHADYWEHYLQVNKLFRDEILLHAKEGDTVWIHDYQLLLLPMLLREALPDLTIGFFLHIPFPSQELFRLIPWRDELLRGMLGADLLGFQTYNDVRHLSSAASRILGAHVHAGRLEFEDRTVLVESFPISIDYDRFATLAQSEVVQEERQRISDSFESCQILLSVDRLDYSKGIPFRLMAYEKFLEDHPEFHRKVVLYMIVVPSRDTVPQYETLKNDIDQEVGRINALFGTMDWQPIAYFYQSFSLAELTALYAQSDVCLVASMRDGMNLVCKEYIASRTDERGVLVLSELAGASHELVDALIINPTNISAFADTIHKALTMPDHEIHQRMKSLQQVVRRFNVYYWAESFFSRLDETRRFLEQRRTKRWTPEVEKSLFEKYENAQKRLFLLDYDGTLVGFKPLPEQAYPDEALYHLLDQLAADPRNSLVLISGRMHQHLDTWFGNRPYSLIAEHGIWQRLEGQDWEVRHGLSDQWRQDVLDLMKSFADRTPGARIEEKSHSIAWHYRKVQTDLGLIRSSEVVEALRDYAADFGLQVLEGNKVIEVRHAGINKGTAALELLDKTDYDLIFAVGDDRTDEDIFTILPPEAYSIKVGAGESHARFFLSSHRDVRGLLSRLIQK